MKAFLVSENLQKQVSLANRIVSTRGTLPSLLNFLIEAEKGKITISATDLETGMLAEVPAKIEEDGAVAVTAKTFTEAVGAIMSSKVGLETTQGALVLKGDRERITFQTFPTEDFPKLYEDKGKKIMVFKKKSLIEDFSKIVFAASPDSDRPALSGVLIKEEDGFMLVATDGYRLSLKKHTLRNAKRERATEDVSVLIPARVIRELVQMSKDGEERDVSVYIAKEKNQIIFSQEGVTLVGRLIDAEFPNYEKIIPTDFSTRVVFEKDNFQKAIKESYVFARQTAGIIKISIQEDKILISANAPSVGGNMVEIEAKTTGEENEIAFNARYLLDFLANTTGEKLSFEMTGPLNPGVFKELNDPSFMHLIMPIRVQQET